MNDLLQLEAFYDAVPRPGSRTEEFGPLTLFVRTGAGWPYYARPTLGGTAEITAADVTKVRERQRELGIPESFEWVAELAPGLAGAATEAGLHVHSHPVLVLGELTGGRDVPGIRKVEADDPELGRIRAVQNVGFGNGGTAVGVAGPAERDAGTLPEEDLADLRKRIADGLTVVYAVFDADGGPVAAGMHQPIGPVSEIVGVATLPSARRRGLGAALTRALTADALAGGAEVVFLSAGDEDVARLYESLGYRQVATAMVAEPAAPEVSS
ncbi:GNAT family N-acetyltransferase [Longispora albida]|uniref:GNAT family N-acetyltransferase n=1 Tax=Longispora albida TaxID=203523 RepID=UPI0003608EBD|nr:GNAT family N-acetyltransferase [Longispora albida]